MRTLLFDIDGTLLVTDRVGSGALQTAMAKEFGVSNVGFDSIQYGGRTDCDIVFDFLSIAGIEATAENQDRLRRRYTSILDKTLTLESGVVLPGVEELLHNLQSKADLMLGVMTGNFAETARMKLKTFRLHGFFTWVIGGDLDRDRSEMAKRAAEQLVHRQGHESVQDVVVIGDTPNDVRCAHAIGARCLAVCTGSATRQELQAARADEIVDNLASPDAYSFLCG